MQGRTRFAPRAAIAALSVMVSAFALAPASEAAPAEACLKAPQGAAPQGSHWYYRLERPSMRKCWYLAEKNRAVAQRTAAATVAPQPEPDEETDAPPAPVANAPASPAAEAPAPVITTLVTRNVSNAEVVAQSTAPDSAQPPVTATAPPGTAADAAAQQAPSEPQTPTAVAEQPVAETAAAAAETTSSPADSLSTLQLLLGATALLGFLSSAAFFVMAMVRRRRDVLSRWRETDALPFEQSPEMAAEEDPAFQPLRALDPIRQRDLDPIRQHDDVDEALRRMMRRRRAA